MWVHYNNTSDQIVMYDTEQTRDFKPIGLWITPYKQEDNWHAWCTGEDFRIEQLKFAHEVVLSPTANILTISDAEGIDTFSEQYGVDLATSMGVTLGGKYNHHCNWKAVAETYDGLIINPYIWERRHTDHSFWYYSWDCASGCIWRANAIERISVIPFEAVLLSG